MVEWQSDIGLQYLLENLVHKILGHLPYTESQIKGIPKMIFVIFSP